MASLLRRASLALLSGVIVAALLAAASPIGAQQRSPVGIQGGKAGSMPTQVRDSLRPPLSPGRAFLNSLLLPGLGQSRLRRQVPAAFYFTIEAVSIAMMHKTRNDLRVAKDFARRSVISR
jgi:hypothetical protein